MKKVLLTGANGQLGRALHSLLGKDAKYQVVYTDVDTLDLTDADAVDNLIGGHGFNYVVNCAAYTDVNRAETDEMTCRRVNADAVANIAKSSHKHDAKLIHVSTDYVFNGEQFHPYVETDEPDPQSAYGRTKLAGETLLSSFAPDGIIIRTAWLYSENGNNFLKTMLRLGNEKHEISVVSDQIGTPTYTTDLAIAIKAILDADEWHSGIYHFSNEGVASWYDFATAIMKIAKLECKVNPISTKDYPTPAKRPFYSVLDKTLIKDTYGIEIPHWEKSLLQCINNIKST